MEYGRELNVFESNVYGCILRVWKARSGGAIDFKNKESRELIKDLNLLPTDYIILESIYKQIQDGKLSEKRV